jgi:hypothetical protein
MFHEIAGLLEVSHVTHEIQQALNLLEEPWKHEPLAQRPTPREETHVKKKSVGLAVVLLLGMSHLALADLSIKPGIDVFGTVAGGHTYYDLPEIPSLPASSVTPLPPTPAA